MNTYSAKAKDIKREYFIADADGKVLGRLASRIATILAGKHKPLYTPHVDTGDYVIVLNADKIKVTGKKATEKIYASYSGYPGGLKEVHFDTMLKRKPKDIIRLAVKRMLPHTRLGEKMLRKMSLYVAAEKPALPKNKKDITV
ncbi:MAG: 50S ribosomal protein L13 [Candidatus Omnitrophica bacterium]|nr:50S ribosomal protein L13 [Candidatus Omnitrophota bacterium]